MSNSEPFSAERTLLPSDADIEDNHRYRERYEGAGEQPGGARESVGEAPVSAEDILRLISDVAHEMVIQFEVGGRQTYMKKYCHPEWPQGDSGITIGFGYDLGYYKPAEVANDWQKLISAQDFEALRPAIGRTRDAAEDLLSSVKQIVIPIEAAESVYRMVTVPKYGRLTRDCFPGSALLHPHCFGALFSLVYNRGSAMKGDKRQEMREIRDAIMSNDPETVPGLLLKMRRHWTSAQSGLWTRRVAEADLFARGLIEMDKARRSVPIAAANPIGQDWTNAVATPRAALESVHGDSRTHIPAFEDGDLSFGPEDLYTATTDVSRGPLERASEPQDWENVHWVENDDLSTEYRHTLAADRSKHHEAIFNFSAADFDLLISANSFAPFPTSERRLIFGLRGATLDAAGSDPDDAFAQVARQSLRLKATRPNHTDFRCVIGVYNIDTRRLSGFIASTVPNRYIVNRYYRKHDQGNMLACGSYGYRVGPHHNGTYPGCLRQDDTVAVLRSRNDPVYDVRDDWDVRTDPPPMDNIHPAFSDKYQSSLFSSFGCQVIRGNFRNGEYTKEFAEFRKALGLDEPGTDDGRIFNYVLLTGLEAAIAARLRKDGSDSDPVAVRESLARIRQGSRGAAVRALQTALTRPATGVFSAYDKQALAILQRKAVGLDAGDGIFTPLLDRTLGFGVFGHDAPSTTTAPLVISSLAPSIRRLETRAAHSFDPIEPVLYEIGRRATLVRNSADLLTAPVLPHFEAIDRGTWTTTVATGNAVVARIERMAHELICAEQNPNDPDRKWIDVLLHEATGKGIPAVTTALSSVLTGSLLLPALVATPVSEVIVARIIAASPAVVTDRRFRSLEAFRAAWGADLYRAAITDALPAPVGAQVTRRLQQG